VKLEKIKEIANAVLYEGYLLYPYRHSAIKNRQRWTIGIVYPKTYSEANRGIDPWQMRTECLVSRQSNQETTLGIEVRFLHLLLRTAKQPATTQGQPNPAYNSEWSLAGRMVQEPHEEGIERDMRIEDVSLSALVEQPRVVEITFPGQEIAEDGLKREQLPISGAVRLSAESLDKDLYKLRVEIENTTPDLNIPTGRYNEVLLQSFVSTHTLMQVQQGNFISLLEPPKELEEAAQGCQNLKTWPVLVGDEGETDTLLSSPIILYDYPQIAPESPGQLFDGTEIDEILTLRILTLTDEEKEQMRQGDERTRELLARTEALTPEQFMQLHGKIRSMKPVDEGEQL
jgi:hydrogenase maturation protease